MVAVAPLKVYFGIIIQIVPIKKRELFLKSSKSKHKSRSFEGAGALIREIGMMPAVSRVKIYGQPSGLLNPGIVLIRRSSVWK